MNDTAVGKARRALAIITLVALANSGCGVLLVRGPDSNRPRGQEPSCTSDMNLVKRDAALVGGGLLAIIIGGLAIERAKQESTETVGGTVIISGVAMMAAGYLSGFIGYRKVKACKSAREEWQVEVQPDETAPPAAPNDR